MIFSHNWNTNTFFMLQGYEGILSVLMNRRINIIPLKICNEMKKIGISFDFYKESSYTRCTRSTLSFIIHTALNIFNQQKIDQ